jgi:hypothetical protein
LRRPSLRSQLNQIRLWVRQGRTDAWIAHALDISVEQLQNFKREQGLDGDPAPAAPPADFGTDLDLDGEEPGDVQAPEVEIEPPDADVEPDAEAELEPDEEPEPDESRPARRGRRRGRRGGRRRGGRAADSYEATFDQGEEGYGLWLDPAVADSDVYSEHWAGHRAVSVTVEPDAITIRRVDDEDGD